MAQFLIGIDGGGTLTRAMDAAMGALTLARQLEGAV